MQPIQTSAWYTYLTPWQRELVDSSFQLLEIFDAPDSVFSLSDYGCVVFPMAKAYEGFLKKYFLDLGFITPELYNSRKFRIGRAFNPDVHQGQRDGFWIYDDVSRACDQQVARELWDAWLQGRNQVFHYFPDEEGRLNLAEAKSKLTIMAEAMEHGVLCERITDRLLTLPKAEPELDPPLRHKSLYQ